MKIISNLREKNLFELLNFIVVGIAIGATLTQFARFFVIAFSRAAFPFTLEWMESGSFVQVSRILAGQPLYVRPSFDFIPQIYPPVYFYISALAAKLFGGGFFPLRLVSILSTIGIFLLIFILVYKQSGSKLGGMLASGLFCATYELSGYWFDIARVDSLALALLLLSAYLLLKNNPAAAIWGGLALTLSCFTKQTMFIVVGVFLVYCVLFPYKNGLIFISITVLSLGIGTLLLNWLHDGWYSYYIFHLPGRHNILPKISILLASTKDILFVEIVKPTFFATLIGTIYLFLFPRKTGSPVSESEWNKANLNRIWLRRIIWILVLTAGLLAVSSIWYLSKLPSNTEHRMIEPYTFLRLLLIAGPVFAGTLIVFLAIKMRKNPKWVDQIAEQLFGEIHTVPRILLGYLLLVSALIIILAYVKPDLFNELSIAYLQRLSPYLISPIVLLITMGASWRFLWPLNHLEKWFYLLLSIGLIATSWLGRLNPGGYYNVFMPAFAGISILFGLGISSILNNRSSNLFSIRNILTTLVLSFSSVQLLVLLSPTSIQIPTQADKEAGLELISHIKACSGDVYVPFHTYLATLAGKEAFAGVVEMGELRGSFGGKRDLLWDEVLNQMQWALNTRTFDAVIQDNQPFRDALSSSYIETGQVFENDLVFWPVTGRKIRPDAFYESIDGEDCLLTVK